MSSYESTKTPNAQGYQSESQIPEMPEPQDQEANNLYKPGKEERKARRLVYERYYGSFRADQNRMDAETDWNDGDEMFGQTPSQVADTDDWRAHLILPDGFAGIQAQMQETIERNSRPYLRRIEDSDKGIETFQNAVLTYNLNRIDFDYQYFLAKYSAAIRGTSYLKEYYRVDKRKVQDPTGVNKDGTLQYSEKELVDFDDAYTEWVPNEMVFIDPDATHISNARDWIFREVIDVDEFKRAYMFRKDCMNINLVRRGGETTVQSFFKYPHDLLENQVEVLHYENRARDCYYIVANNVVVRLGPLPSKHKELSITPIYHYMIPGRMFGMGIPKVIKFLSEERASIRNLNLDRQKMQINKMYLVNDQADFDEDELITRPHGFAEISTNGLSIRDTILPLEYGDVPASYFKTEEILLEDIRRSTGIDDRIQGVNSAGTATAASILRESSQKRINMIAKIAEMDPIKRIGRLKWSNIQFFYPAPRVERITEDNDEREKKIYKKLSVEGQKFTVQKDPETGKTSLKVNELEGSTTFKLDPTMARYLEGDYDVTIDSESVTVNSKAIQQAKITEMFTAIVAIPTLLAELDPRKSLTRYLEVNDESPKAWMKGSGKSDETLMEQAEWENTVMAKGIPLSGTEGANDMHTLVHLQFANENNLEYAGLAPEIKALFARHIMEEHDANPATGSIADMLGSGGAGGPAPTGGMPPGQQPAPMPGVGVTPSTVFGEQPNASTNTNQPL